jgi:hypothetical protein
LFHSTAVLAQDIFHVDDTVEVKGLGGKWNRGKVTEVKSITLGSGLSYSYRVQYNPYGSGSKPINDWIYPANLRASSTATADVSAPAKNMQRPRAGQYHLFNSDLRTLGYFTLIDNKTYFAGTDNRKTGSYRISGKEIVFVTGPFSSQSLTGELIYGKAGTEYEGIVTDIKFIFNAGKSNEVSSYYKYSGQKR